MPRDAMRSSRSSLLQELLLYAATAALSSLVLFVGLRQLDPNHSARKKALEHKKEIAKRLGRPLINTNPYEVVVLFCLFSRHPSFLPPTLFAYIYTGFVAVSAVFSLAYKLQPAIIFIDEVDSFLGQRQNTDQEALANMKTEFMSLWDGFTTDQNARVMVLAATNRPSELDEAILRRFTQTFEIGMPNQNERAIILKVILKGENVEENIDYEYLAALCQDFSGSDLLELCKQAAYFPIRELLNDEKNGKICTGPRPLEQSDLESALVTSRKARKLTGIQPPERPAQTEPNEEEPMHDAILEFSELVSSPVNNQYQSQDA
ncbi:hypothetical protein ZIOFF_023664 [Zingiber officinale]|uniref:Uncharacterized protein n=1 Tax=Zingiber officinale TaxID=94328 RepID=A0A8J5GSX2_ZINOF|nr:hypothetical protein ZIOFF_023664 [Zingiber officinale]